MKEKLLKHFQKEYEVSMGHPTDSNGPATNMIYYVVGKKDGTNSRGRGKDDMSWATEVLKEIGEDYSTEEIKWDYLNKCFACSDCNCCEDENFLHLISTT